MRMCALTTFLAVPAFAFAVTLAGPSPVQAQSAPVQSGQTPQQSDQSRDHDRARAEDVTIGRDWKAQESGNAQATTGRPDKSEETVGRDWRARPEKQDR
jgi:hypothetical protein